MIKVPSQNGELKGSVLFVHGMCHGAWCWDQGFMQEFSNAGYDCYAIDLPGHEKPGKNRAVNRQSIQDYVNAVNEVVDDISKDVIIIGHSMGGFVTQKFLESNSCQAAVLLASVPYSGVLHGSFRYLRAHPDAFPNLITKDIYGPFVKYAEDLYSTQTDRTKIEDYKSLMRSESFKAFLNMIFLPVKLSNPNNVPLLLLGGKEDKLIIENEVEKTGSFYGVEPVLFSGFGHNLMLDKNYELVSGHIIEWLKSMD